VDEASRRRKSSGASNIFGTWARDVSAWLCAQFGGKNLLAPWVEIADDLVSRIDVLEWGPIWKTLLAQSLRFDDEPSASRRKGFVALNRHRQRERQPLGATGCQHRSHAPEIAQLPRQFTPGRSG
jgi:hypothetical protein